MLLSKVMDNRAKLIKPRTSESGVYRAPAALLEIRRTLCTGSDAEVRALIESGGIEELQDEPPESELEY